MLGNAVIYLYEICLAKVFNMKAYVYEDTHVKLHVIPRFMVTENLSKHLSSLNINWKGCRLKTMAEKYKDKPNPYI